jgi:hypothetical protein
MVLLALAPLARSPLLTIPCRRSVGILRLTKVPASGTRTKIVCTIGPASDTPDKVQELVNHGMHVVRLNFSHAGTDYAYPEQCMQQVRNTPGNHFLLSTGAMNST